MQYDNMYMMWLIVPLEEIRILNEFLKKKGKFGGFIYCE